MADLGFDGKVAIITGAGGGLGRSHALELAKRGALIVVNDLGGSVDGEGGSHTAAQKVVDEIKAAGGEGAANTDDISTWEGAKSLITQAIDTFGGLDVLVNNAGIAGPTARVEHVTPEALAETLGVNVASQFHCARHAVPMLKVAGGGSIINLSSIAGRLGFTMRSPYSASKWAVIGFTKSLAVELGESNIRVNAILPGHVDSDRFRRVVRAKAEALGIDFEEMRRQYLDVVSLKRNVAAEDIANMALYLASPFGASITGQAISVCGDVQMMK